MAIIKKCCKWCITKQINLWHINTLGIAALLFLPLISLGVLAFKPSEPIWGHLVETVLARYLTNSLIIGLGASALAMVFGTLSAWFVTFYSFPLSRILRWALLLPLAVPAYVAAYALVDFFEYAGPFQTMLRQIFSFESGQEYMFPEMRSPAMAVIVLACVLYPYVFLMVRAALCEQSSCAYDVARALGKGPVSLFFSVGLPLCRPAIAAGVSIVFMEAVSDFGVVDYFAVQTLTTGIFTLWLERGNIAGAAQLSSLILLIVFSVIFIERLIRRKNRYFSLARGMRSIPVRRLGWGRGSLLTLFCLLPLSFGFILPVAIMADHALSAAGGDYRQQLLSATITSTLLGGIAALLCTALAVLMLAGFKDRNAPGARFTISLTSLGYATPGVVLGVGLLIPIAVLDHHLADGILALTGHDPGLLIIGTGGAVILAYIMRFFTIPLNATDSALGRISPSFFAAGRVLGKTRLGVLTRIQLPMIRGSLIVALLLVFVDTVKELPATLLLRPFNLHTLATRVYESASLENIEAASGPSLVIVSVGLFAVVLLLRGGD